MYSDKLLLLKLDDIQEGLYRLDYNLNASDSLAISKLSDHYCPVKAGKSVFEIVET